MDTRFWGPSGWQLFHLIAVRSKNTSEFLLGIHRILPCKYCRESTKQYTEELPMTSDPARWLYDLHNKVNNKLRIQCKEDPKVICPDPDPSFEEINAKYETMKLTEVPGRDFLFSVAVNYPDNPEEEDMALQRMFMSKLSEVYPFEKLQTVFKKYLQQNPVLLGNRKEYMKWMYELLKQLAAKIPVTIPSYRGYVQHVMYYKSGCTKKTYRGVTCRKTLSGGRTRKRDNAITKKVSHKKLLQSPFSF